MIEAYMQRLEYELHGAWRAGYTYVHVYDPIPTAVDETPTETSSLRQYLLPSHSKRRPNPPDAIYRYSYDLTSVPDEVIRRAVRGDLDMGELASMGGETSDDPDEMDDAE